MLRTQNKETFVKTDLSTRKEILRFFISGTAVIATDFSVYYLLLHFLTFSVSKGISFTCAGLAGYLLNKYWTFKQSRQSYGEAGRYILVNMMALGINVLTNQSILILWPGAVWPALLTATALTSLLSYGCFKWWVFIGVGTTNGILLEKTSVDTNFHSSIGKEKVSKTYCDMKVASPKRATLKSRLLKLWKSHQSPHEIALGIAIGVFIGITPFYGFHILTAFFAALIMKRVNKVAIFMGINISLPPTVPFITWAGYSLGRKILGSASYPPLAWENFRHFSYETFFNFFYALMVGSLILGIVSSVVFYFLIFWFLKRRKGTTLVTGERGL